MRPIFFTIFVPIFCLAFTAQAETISIIGRSLNITPPPGFCKLGTSVIEQEMEQRQRQNTSPVGELAQLTVPCDELADFRSKKIESFSRWAQVVAVKQQGQVRPVTTTRASFVRMAAGSLADTPPDMNALNSRIRNHLADIDSKVLISDARPIGATSEALFVEIKSTVSSGSWSSPVMGVTAITIANQIPLAISVFATPKSITQSLSDTSRAYLTNIVQLN